MTTDVLALAAVLLLLTTACTGTATTGSAASDGSVGATAGPSAPEDGVAATAAPPSSAASDEPAQLRPSEGFAVAEVTFTDDGRTVEVPVLVADDADLRATGLMNRTDLPDDAGMLFVFQTPTSGAFWMKDTLLPLSIAFVGQDGAVQQILDMEPCVADPCPRYSPDEPYLYAVEVNQGFFSARGVAVGWGLDVDDALGGAR